MQDLYGLGMSGVPLEYSSQMRALQQQQMMAQAMLQQSQDPLQNQAPGVAISPTQGLAKIVQAYVGAKGMQNANQGMQGAATKYNDDQNAAVQKVIGAMAPRTLPDSSAGAPATMPRTVEEQRAALVEPLMSQYPNVRNFATSQNALLNQRENREDTQAFQEKTFAENREIRAAEKLAAIEETKRREKVAAEEREINRAHQTELKRLITSGQTASNSVIVQTADGVFAFDKSNQKLTPLVHNGKQLVGSTSDPSLQGDISKAKTGGEAEGKRNFNMQGLGETIQAAEDILSGVDSSGGVVTKAPLPTGSGIGAAADATAGFFGVSPSGSLQAQKLKALSGSLTSKMPRMEGPQSDKDVVMYKEMAAEIGNPTVPVERRKAALAEVKKLWSKYEKPTGETPAAAPPANNGWSIRPIQ